MQLGPRVDHRNAVARMSHTIETAIMKWMDSLVVTGVLQPMPITQEQLAALSRKLADDGRLIESGWAALRAIWVAHDAPDEQVNDMRKAFMAGAQHLFASIMIIMDSERDPTVTDLQRMDLIHKELEAFARSLGH